MSEPWGVQMSMVFSILRRITIGAYAMLPFRRATAYNSLIA